MKSIKEKQLLVKWARAMNEPVDPALAEEVDRYNQLQQEIKESIRSNTINDLFDASKVAVDIINKVTIEYPKPPTLEELLSIVQEESNELVQAQAAETPTTIEEASPPDTPRTEAVEPTDLISRAANHIHKEVKLEENSFQQPQPTPVEKNFNDVQKKLKFLEQAIGKIAATGPGSGEVELKRLDDVDFASVSGATNNQVLSYNATSQLWFARSVTSGGGGIALTDLSVTVNTPSSNGNLTYNDSTGVFNFTPANLSLKANVADLTTANVVELTNLYFTNARAIGSLTAGGNITIDSNGRINSTATGGGGTDTLATVTNRGNVTTNGITVNNANVNFLSVNTSAGFTVTTGQIAWNAADLTFDMGMANGVTLQVGQEQYIKVKAGSAISDGQAIMFAGADGEHIIAAPNDATTAGYIPEWFIGIATQDIARNGFGYITTFGKVHNINTLAWNEGDILYADPTTVGGLVNTEPAAPYPNIVVAAVTKRAGGDGHLMVRPTWRSDLHQLNDVSINGVTNGQVLTYQNNVWYNRSTTSANVTELTNLYYTNARVYSNVISIGYATNSNVALKANVADLKTANVAEVTNLYFTNARAVAAVTASSISVAGGITANAATAFTAGPAAISGVALAIPYEGGIRNSYNGLNNMYFDVSTGGTTHGQFQFRSGSSFTNILTMSPTAFNVNTDAVVTAKTASFGRLPWNSAIDTVLTVDDYRFRINTTTGNTYAQVISNTGGTKNSAWTAVAAISGQAIGQGGSTGTLVPNNAWTSLYTFASMNSAGDTVTVTFQDKNLGRIYRITFMRSDDGSTTGYNIIAERLI